MDEPELVLTKCQYCGSDFLCDCKEKLKDCKGLVFKGYKSVFYFNGRIEFKEGFRLLKRESCKCEHCANFLDSIIESLCLENLGYFVLPEKGIKDGAKYGVRGINFRKDWETGIVDDYDIEFYEKEKSKNEHK